VALNPIQINKMNIITRKFPILEVETKKGTMLIPLHKIVSIKAFNKGSIINPVNSNIIETKYLIKSYSRFLPVPYFFRCHNSYLVNCKYVDCYTSSEIILKGNVRIPLSRSKKQLFIENMIEFLQIS